MNDRFLHFRRFGVGTTSRAVIANLDWDLPDRGLVHLIGPAGAGKSLIGQVLARHQWATDFWHWGELSFRGLDWRICEPAAYLDDRALPATGELGGFLLQKMPPEGLLGILEADGGGAESGPPIRRWVEKLLRSYGLDDLAWNQNVSELDPGLQRCVALVRELAAVPKVVFLDAASKGLSARGQERFWEVVRRASQEMLIMAAARPAPPWPAAQLPGTIVWLADGQLRQLDDWSAVRRLATASSPDRTTPLVPPSRPPRWLQWIVWGQLAGMPRPGLIRELGKDIETLTAQGITTIVGLEEEPVNRAALEAAGLDTLHVPVVDMETPSPETAWRLGSEILARIDRGESVALHCKAGLGRTGTMLAICLILRGYSATQAFVFLRQLNQHYIQSDEQHRFVEDFARSWSRGEVHVE